MCFILPYKDFCSEQIFSLPSSRSHSRRLIWYQVDKCSTFELLDWRTSSLCHILLLVQECYETNPILLRVALANQSSIQFVNRATDIQLGSIHQFEPNDLLVCRSCGENPSLVCHDHLLFFLYRFLSFWWLRFKYWWVLIRWNCSNYRGLKRVLVPLLNSQNLFYYYNLISLSQQALKGFQ